MIILIKLFCHTHTGWSTPKFRDVMVCNGKESEETKLDLLEIVGNVHHEKVSPLSLNPFILLLQLDLLLYIVAHNILEQKFKKCRKLNSGKIKKTHYFKNERLHISVSGARHIFDRKYKHEIFNEVLWEILSVLKNFYQLVRWLKLLYNF